MTPYAWSRKNAWALLPRIVRRAAGRALATLPPERLLGRRFRETRAFLAESQWWPAERNRAYQLQRLQHLCAQAYSRSPYYRGVFDAAGLHPADLRTPEDLRRLPLLDRATVRERGREMLIVSRRSPRVDAVSTGGTSGVPLHFYIGAERSDVEYAFLTAGWERSGFRLGETKVVLKGDVVPADRNGLHHDYDPVLRRHTYSAFHLTEDQIPRYLEHIAQVGPCHLLAYPSVLILLARYIRRSGLPSPANVRSVIAESEIVYPEQRAFVEDTFRCRYFSLYGMTEKVVAAAECEHSTHAHVWPTYGVFELIDAHGQPVTVPGQRGEIVGTSFMNTVMPFIRYRTGDYATYVGEGCDACGRRHPLIADIRGHRVQESIVASDGSLVPWSALNMHDDTFLHVARFQFLQTAPGTATLRVVPEAHFTTADAERILRKLRGKLEGRIEVRIELVESLPVSERGKAIYVDQRIGWNAAARIV